MPATAYELMTDSQLRVEYIKLCKDGPDSNGCIRFIQSICEQRCVLEIASSEPDERRIQALQAMIDGIDSRYIRDYTKYGNHGVARHASASG